MSAAKARGSQTATRVMGVIILIFALIGFVTVVVLAGKGIALLFDNSEERRRYGNQISSLVMLDPMPFDDVSKIQQEVAAEACIMEIAKNNSGEETYEYDTEGRMLVPVSEIQAQAEKMFGPDVTLDLTALDYDGSPYRYNGEEDSVHVPITGYTYLYYPRVESIRHSDGVTTLHVAYMPTSVSADPAEVQPEKYMDYVLEGEKGSEIITAVKLAE